MSAETQESYLNNLSSMMQVSTNPKAVRERMKKEIESNYQEERLLVECLELKNFKLKSKAKPGRKKKSFD